MAREDPRFSTMTSRNCRVLLVEDQQDEALLFSAAVTRAEVPWSVRVVTGRRDAIHALSEPSVGSDNATWAHPDIIVLDLQLGDESGFHVLRWVRTQRETRTIPVILLSSSTDPGHRQQAEEYGGTEFIAKPMSLDRMVEVVRELHGRTCAV